MTHVTSIGRGKARYFATQADLKLIYVGGEAEPIWGTSALAMAQRAIGLPIKAMVNICTNAIIYKSNVAFCSKNLTLVYKRSA